MVKGQVHGIKSAHLPHGVAHRYILQPSRYGKVLQLVEDKVQLIVLLRIVNPYQRLAQRCVLKVV